MGGVTARQVKRGKALEQAEWKDRLSVDGSLNLYQTPCQHALHASEPNALTEWLNFLPVFLSSLLCLCLDLPGFIRFTILPKGGKQFMFALKKKNNPNLHYLQRSVASFPSKPRASFTAKGNEKGGESWPGLPCPLSLSLSLRFDFHKRCNGIQCVGGGGVETQSWEGGNSAAVSTHGRRLCSVSVYECSESVMSESLFRTKGNDWVRWVRVIPFIAHSVHCSHRVTSSCVPFDYTVISRVGFMRPLLSNNVSSWVYEKPFHCVPVITQTTLFEKNLIGR